MASEFEKMLVRNMDQQELLQTISERVDLVDIVEKFRYSEDYAPCEYLTIEQLQEYLHCGRNYALQVARYGLSTGEYTVNHMGRKYLVDRISYDKYVKRKLGKSLKEVVR